MDPWLLPALLFGGFCDATLAVSELCGGRGGDAMGLCAILQQIVRFHCTALHSSDCPGAAARLAALHSAVWRIPAQLCTQ